MNDLSAAVATPVEGASGEASPPRVLCLLVLAYLFLDYARPQDVIPGLGLIRPAAIVTLLLAAAYLAMPRRWVRSSQYFAIWAFVALLAGWVPFARNNFFAYKTFTAMLFVLPLVLSIPVCMRSPSAVRGALGFCVLLMTWQAAWAILHGGRGTGAGLADENDLALFVNTYIPFAYFLFRAEKRASRKLFYAAALVIGIGAVVASRSRGGFVGLIAVGAVVWLLSAKKIRSLVIIAIAAWCLTLFANAAYWQRMSTATDSESGTGRARVESWKAGWRMFVSRPLGVGGGNYPVHFPEYQGGYFKRGMWGREAHSIWFTLLPELGVPGVLVYGWLMFVNFRDSFRMRRIGRRVGGEDGALLRALGSAFLASFVGFFASGTFLSVLYYPHYWYLSGFVVATTAAAASMRPGEGAVSTS
jgi:hypothetical protein